MRTTLNRKMDRRGFVRLLGGGTLAVAGGALLLPHDASAGIGWCRADPLIVVNGTLLQIYPERDGSAVNTCSGPIVLVVSVPPGATTAVLEQDAGFGFGYDISFVESTKIPAGQYQIDMYVPATSGMAVRLVCDPVDPTAKTTIKSGTANTWIKVITKV